MILATGTAVANATTGSAAQAGGNATEAATVTAEDIEAEEVRLENVTVSDLTVRVEDFENPETAVRDAFAAALGENVEGFEATNVRIGTIQSATINIENDVATIDAEVESITVEGVEADRVTFEGSASDMGAMQGLFMQDGLSADSLTAEQVEIGTLTVESAAEAPDVTEEPDENVTEDNVTEPDENVTEVNVTEPEDNVTDVNVTEPDENVTEDNVTEDNVTDVNVTEPDENVTEDNVTEPDENVTEDNVTEDGVIGVNETDGVEDNVTDEASVNFEDQTTNGTVVTVDNVTVPEGGYVAIHNSSLFEGEVVGSVVGVSEYLESGSHENVSVTLFNVTGAEFDREVLDDENLTAMPHQETNDNETYDFVATNGTEDGAYLSDGAPVIDNATMTIEAEDEVTEDNVTEPVDNVTEDNVTEPDENVTEDNVTEDGVIDENVTEDNVTEDNVTEDGVTEDNVTDVNVTEPDENVTEDNVTEDNVTDGGAIDGDETDNVTDDEAGIVDGNETDANETEEASVTLERQVTNGTVLTVQEVTVPEGGYVAIHNSTLFEGEVVGSVVGVSEYLEPGTHENVTIRLLDVPGADFERDRLNDHRLTAMPHQETNDNETYDFVATNGTEDGAYTIDGEPVIDNASTTLEILPEDNVTDENVTEDEVTDNVTEDNVTEDNVTEDTVTDGGAVEANETADEVSVTFENQMSNGTTVVVDSVTLNDDGYVAIHNSSLFDGEVVGSVIGVSEHLEPGTHENVSVTLFNVTGAEFEQDALTEGDVLVAMPHQENTGNQTYDFVASNGTADGPFTIDGEPVIENASVTVEEEA